MALLGVNQAAQEAELDKLAAAVEAAEAAATDAERSLRDAHAAHEAERQQLQHAAAAQERRARVRAPGTALKQSAVRLRPAELPDMEQCKLTASVTHVQRLMFW